MLGGKEDREGVCGGGSCGAKVGSRKKGGEEGKGGSSKVMNPTEICLSSEL